MNKKLIGYILLAIGIIPILFSILAISQVAMMYLIQVTFGGIMPVFIHTLIAIGFASSLVGGIYLLKKDVKK